MDLNRIYNRDNIEEICNKDFKKKEKIGKKILFLFLGLVLLLQTVSTGVI